MGSRPAKGTALELPAAHPISSVEKLIGLYILAPFHMTLPERTSTPPRTPPQPVSLAPRVICTRVQYMEVPERGDGRVLPQPITSQMASNQVLPKLPFLCSAETSERKRSYGCVAESPDKHYQTDTQCL